MKVFIALLAFCALVQLSNQVALSDIPPTEVTTLSAGKLARYHHLFFHTTRMYFLLLNQRQQRAIMNLGWEPPRPAKGYYLNGNEIVLDGDAGEDFLFMHRKMIAKVNAAAAAAGSSWRVNGWSRCPAPGDPVWPVPPAYTVPDNAGFTSFVAMAKTDDFYWDTIVPAEEWLEDSDNLRSITLGQLGVKLEFELHTWFHLRFSAANSVGYRLDNTLDPVAAIDNKWNVPEYDWLADFYSAHVNVHFWKIHGWIEKNIEAWRVANRKERIQWNGVWEGGPINQQVFDKLAVAAAPGDVVEPSDETSSSSDLNEPTVDPAVLTQIVDLLLAASNPTPSP